MIALLSQIQGVWIGCGISVTVVILSHVGVHVWERIQKGNRR